MRVLIINKFLYPNGGSETYIFKLGEALEQHGHEVQYFGMELSLIHILTVFVYPALVSAAGPNQPSGAARSAEMPRPARTCCTCSAEKVTVYS